MNPLRALTLALFCSWPATALPAAQADPMASTPAGRLWTRATAELSAAYDGPNAARLPDILRAVWSDMRKVCAPEYDPKVCDEALAVSLLGDVSSALDDGHSHVAFLHEADDLGLRPGEAGQHDDGQEYGYRVTLGTAGYVVTEVHPESAPAEAGLRVGDVLDTVNGYAITSDVDVAGRFRDLHMIVRRQGRKMELHTERRHLAEDFQMRPSLREEGGLSVLRVPHFWYSGTAAQVHALLRPLAGKNDARVILDLRGAGGFWWECLGTAGAFLDTVEAVERGPGVHRRYRFAAGRLEVAEVDAPDRRPHEVALVGQPGAYRGRLAVLVDEQTGACGTQTAALVRRGGRARVYGTPTASGAERFTWATRLDRTRVWHFPRSALYFPDGARFPTALTPEVPVATNLDRLAAEGRDEALERARADLLGPAR